MHQILIKLLRDKFPPQFDINVSDDLFAVFCQYLKDNYPNIGCQDSRMPEELRLVIECGLNEYVSQNPKFANASFAFVNRQVDSVLKTTILCDDVVQVKEVLQGSLCETHEGIVVFEGRQFSFDYEFTYDPSKRIDVNYRPLYNVGLLPDKKFTGHDLSLIPACEMALKNEAEALKYENGRKEWKEWEIFYRANVEVFHDWFTPLLNSPFACSKAKSYLKNAVISKKGIRSLELGICPFCPYGCLLVTNPNRDKKHDPQWYDLKLDDIPCSLELVSALHPL